MRVDFRAIRRAATGRERFFRAIDKRWEWPLPSGRGSGDLAGRNDRTTYFRAWLAGRNDRTTYSRAWLAGGNDRTRKVAHLKPMGVIKG